MFESLFSSVARIGSALDPCGVRRFKNTFAVRIGRPLQNYVPGSGRISSVNGQAIYDVLKIAFNVYH